MTLVDSEDPEQALEWFKTVALSCAELEGRPADQLHGLDMACYLTLQKVLEDAAKYRDLCE